MRRTQVILHEPLEIHERLEGKDFIVAPDFVPKNYGSQSECALALFTRSGLINCTIQYDTAGIHRRLAGAITVDGGAAVLIAGLTCWDLPGYALDLRASRRATVNGLVVDRCSGGIRAESNAGRPARRANIIGVTTNELKRNPNGDPYDGIVGHWTYTRFERIINVGRHFAGLKITCPLAVTVAKSRLDHVMFVGQQHQPNDGRAVCEAAGISEDYHNWPNYIRGQSNLSAVVMEDCDLGGTGRSNYTNPRASILLSQNVPGRELTIRRCKVNAERNRFALQVNTDAGAVFEDMRWNAEGYGGWARIRDPGYLQGELPPGVIPN